MKVSSTQQHQQAAKVETPKEAAVQARPKAQEAQEAPKAPPPAHLGRTVDTKA